MGVLLENIYYFVLISAILSGFVFIIQNKCYGFLHTLPFFLVYTFILEEIGNYLSKHNQPNIWLFNYSSIVEFVYYMWLVSKMYIEKKAIKTVHITSAIFSILTLLNIIYFQGKTAFVTITFGIGTLLLIGCCIYYFFQLLLFPNQVSLIKEPQFWVCSALLFFYSCSFPIFCLNSFYSDKISVQIWPIINRINYLINIVFYSLFIVAFLCKIKFKVKTV